MSGTPALNKGQIALSPAQQDVVPVLSMHRAGGSLVARLMNIMGVELGWPLQPVGPDNPRGTWEHRLFQTVNRQLLAGFGVHSDAMATPEQLTEYANKMARLDLAESDKADLGARIATNFMHPAWGWKDPRTAVAWPFWSRLLSDLGYERVRPVVVVRHPDACFRGLQRWGLLREAAAASGMSEQDFSHSMWWATYQILMATDLDAEQTLIVCLEDLLDPATAPAELARLAQHVGADFSDCQRALEWIELSAEPREDSPSDPNLQALFEGLQALAREQRDAFLATEPRLPAGASASPRVLGDEKAAQFCVFQVSPAGYPHAQAFDEIALSLHHGLEALGHRAPLVRRVEDIQGQPIVVGANLIGRFVDTTHIADQLPRDTILYNLEQIDPNSDWMTDAYRTLLDRFRVWDYSPANAQRLQEMGVSVEGICGIGYVPQLSCIDQDVEEDIDVLFYGGMNPRRKSVLEALKARGLNVVIAANCFGEARDQLVARSKVVINIHFYEAKVLEMVRISYLLANAQCVVSETGVDRQEEAVFQDAIAFSSYEGLVERCVELVQNPAQRNAYARRAKTLFSSMRQASYLSERLS